MKKLFAFMVLVAATSFASDQKDILRYKFGIAGDSKSVKAADCCDHCCGSCCH